ncbi:hypothetical protein KIW84_033083 [Lathyrus oleraceus]|uniref:Uncharacterized protein n=1 Tax=Pisum sativum TaxID=3888 RepID=A0A9D4XZQ0_PEA|nr:hypothetical protein KIW84_033083 [Pisum sativum]
MHDNDIYRDIILPKIEKNGRCKPSPPPQRRFDPDNGPWVGIHGKKKPPSIYEEGLKILNKEGLLPPDDPTLVTWSPTGYCRTSKPFIHPSEVQPDGKLKPLTKAEEVLNWKSENMVSQNEILQNLGKRVDKIVEKIDETDEYLKMLEERTFGKTFDQKEIEIRKRPSPFYPSYVSSPPDHVRYIPTAYRPKSTRTATPSTSKTKGKASCLSVSSSDSQDIPEIPPPKIQKEEETPDKGFQATTITRNYESPHKNHPLAETSTQKEDESSTDGDNNSDQEISTDETPIFVSSKSKSEDNYIPRLFVANIKEEESFFEEESPEETLIPKRTKPNCSP